MEEIRLTYTARCQRKYVDKSGFCEPWKVHLHARADRIYRSGRERKYVQVSMIYATGGANHPRTVFKEIKGCRELFRELRDC